MSFGCVCVRQDDSDSLLFAMLAARKGLMSLTGFNSSKYHQQIDNLMIHIMKTGYKLRTSWIQLVILISSGAELLQTLHTLNLIKASEWRVFSLTYCRKFVRHIVAPAKNYFEKDSFYLLYNELPLFFIWSNLAQLCRSCLTLCSVKNVPLQSLISWDTQSSLHKTHTAFSHYFQWGSCTVCLHL